MTSLLVFVAPPRATAADFPEVAQLPAQPALPDPLVMFDGRPVTSPEQWVARRRPELKALFQYYMYGQMPPSPDLQAATITREDRSFLDGRATLKEVTITLGADDLPRIHLLLVVPNERKGPVPAFLGTNFMGNHTVIDDPKVALPTAWMPERGPSAKDYGVKDHKATDAGRGVIRPGTHSMGREDWAVWLKYTDKHLRDMSKR